MKYGLALTIALLLGVPVATANPDTSTLVQFKQAEHAGLVELEGNVLVFFKFGDHQMPGHGLKIRADRGLMELDHITESAHVAGASFNEEQPMESYPFTDSRLVSSPHDEDAYMAVFALPGADPPIIQATTTCATYQRGPESVEVSHYIHGRRDEISIPTPSSINATLCPGTLHLRGSFMLVLWEWGGALHSTGGEVQNFTTGRTYGTRIDDPRTDSAVVYEGERVQAYVTLWDATMQYPFSGSLATLISASITGSTEGSATLVDGGLAKDWGVLEPRTIELSGHIGGPFFAGAERGLMQDMEGTIQFMGESGFVTGATPTTSSTILLWPFFLVLVALVVLLVPTSRAWVQVSKRLTGIGFRRTAIGLATWATVRDRSDAGGYMQRAIARRQAGKFAGAERDLIRAGGLVTTPRNRARIALERARVCSDMGHREEYAWWLHQVNQLDSSLLADVEEKENRTAGRRFKGDDGWMLP